MSYYIYAVILSLLLNIFVAFSTLFVTCVARSFKSSKLTKIDASNRFQNSEVEKSDSELRDVADIKQNFFRRFFQQSPFRRKPVNHRLLERFEELTALQNEKAIEGSELNNSLNENRCNSKSNSDSNDDELQNHRLVGSAEELGEKSKTLSVENTLYFPKTLVSAALELPPPIFLGNQGDLIEGEVFVIFHDTSGSDFESNDTFPWLTSDDVEDVAQEREMIFRKYAQAKYYYKLQRSRLGLPSRSTSVSSDCLTSPKTLSHTHNTNCARSK